jgi:hypothetical protein
MIHTPNNADRASWAETALEAFQAACPTDDCDAIADLIVDLCHLARFRARDAGEPFDAGEFLAARALMHDVEESEDSDDGDDTDTGEE